MPAVAGGGQDLLGVGGKVQKREETRVQNQPTIGRNKKKENQAMLSLDRLDTTKPGPQLLALSLPSCLGQACTLSPLVLELFLHNK